MADELKSFEQTHWLRELLAMCSFAESALQSEISAVRESLPPESDFIQDWLALPQADKLNFRSLADSKALAFKAAVEAAQQEAA